jgi:hypothetical protein
VWREAGEEMKLPAFLQTILIKLQLLDPNDNMELDLEALMLWVFLFITAFRALFANLTITIGPSIKWTIPDINLAATLPMMYSLLSNSHKRYLQSKTGATNGQSSPPTTNNQGS